METSSVNPFPNSDASNSLDGQEFPSPIPLSRLAITTTLTSSDASSPSIARGSSITKSSSDSSSVSLPRATSIVKSLSGTASPSLTKLSSLIKSLAQAQSTSITKLSSITKTITQAQVALNTKALSITKSIAQAQGISALKNASITKSSSDTSISLITKNPKLIKSSSGTTTPTLSKSSSLTKSIIGSLTPSLAKAFAIIKTISEATSPSVKKNSSIYKSSSSSNSIVMKKNTNKSLFQSYQDIILASQPVLYWPLNETSGGTVHDISGSGYDVVDLQDQDDWFWHPNVINSGFPGAYYGEYNGAAQNYVLLQSNSFFLDESIAVAVEFWFESVYDDYNNTGIAELILAGFILLFRQGLNNAIVLQSNSGPDTPALVNLQGGESYHFVINADYVNHLLYLYINNELIVTKPIDPLDPIINGLTGPAFFFSDYASSPAGIHRISDLAIYQRLLSNNEIASHYSKAAAYTKKAIAKKMSKSYRETILDSGPIAFYPVISNDYIDGGPNTLNITNNAPGNWTWFDVTGNDDHGIIYDQVSGGDPGWVELDSTNPDDQIGSFPNGYILQFGQAQISGSLTTITGPVYNEYQNDEISIEFWFSPRFFTQNAFFKFVLNTFALVYQYNSNTLEFEFITNNPSSGSFPLDIDQIYYIVITSKVGNGSPGTTLWINGEILENTFNYPNQGNASASTFLITNGDSGGSITDEIYLYLAEPAFYNRVLTSQEIAEHYHHGLYEIPIASQGPKNIGKLMARKYFPGEYSTVVLASGPTSYWKLDDALGSTTAIDNVGSHNGIVPAGDVFQSSPLIPEGSSLKIPSVTDLSHHVRVPYNSTFNPDALFITIELWLDIKEAFDNGIFGGTDFVRTIWKSVSLDDQYGYRIDLIYYANYQFSPTDIEPLIVLQSYIVWGANDVGVSGGLIRNLSSISSVYAAMTLGFNEDINGNLTDGRFAGDTSIFADGKLISASSGDNGIGPGLWIPNTTGDTYFGWPIGARMDEVVFYNRRIQIDEATLHANAGFVYGSLEPIVVSPFHIPNFEYRNAVLASSPTAYWPLDEERNAITAKDVAHNHNGTIPVSITTGQPPLIQQGHSIDSPYTTSLSDKISVPNIANSVYGFSIEFWFSLKQAYANGVLNQDSHWTVWESVDTNGGIRITGDYYLNGNIGLGFGPDTLVFAIYIMKSGVLTRFTEMVVGNLAVNYPVDELFIAFTFVQNYDDNLDPDPGSVIIWQYLYPLGLLASAGAGSTGANDPTWNIFNNTGSLYFGGGRLDEVAYWNRILSADEVQAHYDAATTKHSYFLRNTNLLKKINQATSPTLKKVSSLYKSLVTQATSTLKKNISLPKVLSITESVNLRRALSITKTISTTSSINLLKKIGKIFPLSQGDHPTLRAARDRVYSREIVSSLPTTPAQLATGYNSTDYVNIDTDDGIEVLISGTSGYAVHEYRDPADINSSYIAFVWNGQSQLAPTTSAVYLQVFNWAANAWQTLTYNNSAPVNTDFTLNGIIASDVSDYYSSTFETTFRVYQKLS